MDLITTLTAIGTVAAKFSAVIGLGKALHGFFKYFAKTNAVTELRKELTSTRLTLEKDDVLDGDQFLDKFLACGSVIASCVRRRLVGRLISGAVIIVGVQLAGMESRAATSYDTVANFAQALIQIGTGFLVFSGRVFNQQEKIFFHNMNALEEVFYERYVLPAVISFNEVLAKSMDKPIFETEDWKKRLGEISGQFHKALAKSVDFEAGTAKSEKELG